MAIDIFSTGALTRVVNSLDVPVPHLTNRYFTGYQQSTDARIYFDVENKTRRIAPFVSPVREGKVIDKDGFTTHSFEPPYLKPKTDIDPNKQFKRTMGEALMGSLTPQQRRDAAVATALKQHREMVEQRKEVMASEALRTGKITVTGDGYGTVQLDFERAATLTIALAGAALWSADTATPLANLEAWALLVQQNGGGVVDEVTMDPDAWAAFKARLTEGEKQVLFSSLRGSTSEVELGPRTAEKASYEGKIGKFNLFVYNDQYVDEDGADQNVLPSGTVILTGATLDGVQAYAAIRDPRAGFQPVPIYSKSWIQEDPAMEWVLSQSAMLMVPYRPNGSLCATVL